MAAGTAGPLRQGFGPVRDHVLGMSVVTGDGRVVHAGDAKNVAGYDLGKLQIGGFGGFGIITELNLRLEPCLAQTRRSLLAPGAITSPASLAASPSRGCRSRRWSSSHPARLDPCSPDHGHRGRRCRGGRRLTATSSLVWQPLLGGAGQLVLAPVCPGGPGRRGDHRTGCCNPASTTHSTCSRPRSMKVITAGAGSAGDPLEWQARIDALRAPPHGRSARDPMTLERARGPYGSSWDTSAPIARASVRW